MEFTLKVRARYLLKSYRDLIKGGDRVLDVGCGNGVVGRVIREKTGCTLRGIDLENRLAGEIPFTLMEKDTELPFADREFDVAMLNGMMHHVPQSKQAELLRECVRVATIVLMHDDYPTLGNKAICWAVNKIHYPALQFSQSFRAPGEWEELFIREGIEYNRLGIQTPWWYPLKHVAYLLKNTP